MIVKDINVNEKNIKDIISQYALDEDLLLDVQDSSEIARFLEKNKYTEVILKYPEKNDISTLGIYLENNKILFLHTDEFPFNINNKLTTTTLILVDIINQITENYFKILKTIDKKIRKIKLASKTSVKNSDLLTLFELQNDIDDFVISIKGNLSVLNKIISTNQNNEFINDAKIENEQALETALSYSKTVSNLKSTLEIITNNITNKRMESLTVVNVSALIITSISGLYGMNVRLPLSNIYNIFYYIILVSIIFALSFGFFLKKRFSEKK
ncbi:MAG: CorA family divalent cation transporter [Alphaproteobacteria bacterium]